MTVEGCLVYSQLYLLIHDSGGMIGTFTVTYYILCYDSGWGDRDIWELHEQSSPFQRMIDDLFPTQKKIVKNFLSPRTKN